MAHRFHPSYLCVGSIYYDDIVFPDGRTVMGALGGVTHAAAGMVIWAQRPGLVACAGHDLPDNLRLRLLRDFDLEGVLWLDVSQPRAWQLFEWDGRRSEVFHAGTPEPFVSGPPPDALPPCYRRARGAYLLRDGAVAEWREALPNATLLWEPVQRFMTPQNASTFRATLPQVDIVSPDWHEARAIYGLLEPGALVRAMLDDGARVAALRLGERGSIVGRQGDRDLLRVPAVPVPRVVDRTGAGSTYCGGFLAGWCETGDLAEAACRGAVAASFALEVTGVAEPPEHYAALREARLRALSGRLRVVH